MKDNMKENRIISLIGMVGFISMLYGGFVFNDPSSIGGTMFGLIGIALAFFPVYYLWFDVK